MSFSFASRLGGSMLALSLGFASLGVAQAQSASGAGLVLGEVDKCVSGNETPVSNVSVGISGGESAITHTDQNGGFALALAPGQYTVQATADDGTSATRAYVPVEADSSLDIGILELAGGCGGADIGAPPPAQAQPTAAPTAAPTVAPTDVPATPTPAPPPPTATAVPDDQQAAPADEGAPDDSAPDQTAPSDQSAPAPDQSPDTSTDAGG